jgi:predicted ATPase
LEQGIALYNPQHHRSHVFLYGHDPGVWCRFFAAWALWHLGYPDQALTRSHEALTLVQGSSHPFILANALGYIAMLHQLRREVQATQERAEAEMVLAHEHGLGFMLAEATFLRGWALAEQGQGEAGIAQMRQGLAAWQALGAELFRPYYLALLAEAYGKGGQSEEGMRVVTEALALVAQSGEHRGEAELYRLKGTLMLQSKTSHGPVPDPSQTRQDKSEEAGTQHPAPHTQAEVESCFRQALDIARRQQAKSWELRAAMSLARLWQRQGKRAEAYQLLAEIYDWFTEGFDTADLQEAKALLEELV